MAVERKSVDKSSLRNVSAIWVLGGPGSGKGTQCEKIGLRYGYTHLSTGELLRHEVMSASNRGQQIYKLMANGESVPNEIVNDLLAEAMLAKTGSKGFLIDGFPIDQDQASAFEADICSPALVLAFQAGDNVLRDRLLSRNNFDDTDESIRKRLDNFNTKTRPVVDKYAAKIVNAERNAEEIFVDVQKIFDDALK